MKNKKDFPYYDVVYNTIKKHRGKIAADSWAGIFDGHPGYWGSHWYNALGAMLNECKTDADARAAVETLFYLGDHYERVQNNLFNHYTGIHDPVFGDEPKKQNETKKRHIPWLFFLQILLILVLLWIMFMRE